jgi:mannan endo-1,4-beta-mannosidase
MHDRTGAATARRTATTAGTRGLPWISVAPGAPYFVDDTGAAFTPIGQNDAVTWMELRGLYGRKNLPAVEAHLHRLRASGVTVLRLMLEYAQRRGRYFERPMGRWNPAMVQLWDDLLAMCELAGLRVLLTPFDTYWTWVRWANHPYNRVNGGVLDEPCRMLLDPAARDAIKARLAFATERWGGSGVIFAWDLWNEIHPAQAQESVDCWPEFIHDLSSFVRDLELRLYGRCHPRTVSLFGPELRWRSHMPLQDPIFRHPELDFASIHIYAEGAIDDPVNTVDCAAATADIVRGALAEIVDGRPFLDSEHGPICRYKDRRSTLPAAFDDEYFRHMQWAHLAAGGAGGGMRWPNRTPHVLTPGMRAAQRAASGFLDLVDWPRFRRINLNREVGVSDPAVTVAACGDDRQTVVWLLRTDTVGSEGRVRRDVQPIAPTVFVPGLGPGRYRVTAWDTLAGTIADVIETAATGSGLAFVAPAFVADRAFAVRRL